MGGIDSGTDPNPLIGHPARSRRRWLAPWLSNWIFEATNPIDEMVPPVEPQPDLESSVVVPHPVWLLQHPSPLHGIRA